MARHVTVTEAATLTGRSPRTIARWITKGQVESQIIDGRRMVDADTLTDTSDTTVSETPTSTPAAAVSMIPLADLAPLFDRLADAERRAVRAETELAWLRERRDQELEDGRQPPDTKVEEPPASVAKTFRDRWKNRKR